MTLSGWSRLSIVAGALAVCGCEDAERQAKIKAIEKELELVREEIRLREEILKVIDERFPDVAGAPPASEVPDQ